MEDKKTQKYELGFLLDKEEDVKVVMKYLADGGAQVSTKGNATHIALSYPIKKHDKAYFGWVRFAMPTESVPALANALRLDAKVLRTLLIASPFEGESKAEFNPRTRARKPVAKEMSNEVLEEKLAAMKSEAK